MPTTAELTAWEVWDGTATKLYSLMLDTEQDTHEAQSEVESFDEAIAEAEAELKKLQAKRAHYAAVAAQSKQTHAKVTKQYNAHLILEPEQD